MRIHTLRVDLIPDVFLLALTRLNENQQLLTDSCTIDFLLKCSQCGWNFIEFRDFFVEHLFHFVVIVNSAQDSANRAFPDQIV